LLGCPHALRQGPAQTHGAQQQQAASSTHQHQRWQHAALPRCGSMALRLSCEPRPSRRRRRPPRREKLALPNAAAACGAAAACAGQAPQQQRARRTRSRRTLARPCSGCGSNAHLGRTQALSRRFAAGPLHHPTPPGGVCRLPCCMCGVLPASMLPPCGAVASAQRRSTDRSGQQSALKHAAAVQQQHSWLCSGAAEPAPSAGAPSMHGAAFPRHGAAGRRAGAALGAPGLPDRVRAHVSDYHERLPTVRNAGLEASGAASERCMPQAARLATPLWRRQRSKGGNGATLKPSGAQSRWC
jgi:hypothetical protein